METSAKRIVLDVETVGPRGDEQIEKLFEENLRASEPPVSVRRGSKDAEALERAEYWDYYQELKKGKGEWLAENWNSGVVLEKRVEVALEAAATDPLLAVPIVIAVAIDDNPVGVTSTEERGTERELIDYIASFLNEHAGPDTVWIGHNSDSFDLPLLVTRWRRLGILPPAWFPEWRYGRIRGATFDTMKESASKTPFVSAQTAAIAHGLDGFKVTMWGDAPMDGSRVAEAHKAGEWALIREYCRADVEATRELARVMTFGWRWLDRRQGAPMQTPVQGEELLAVACGSNDPGERLNGLLDWLVERGLVDATMVAAMRTKAA